jgi:outer membrane autotransporter protein
VNTDRTVIIAGADRLHADFDAQAFGGRLEAGWRYAMPTFGITPYAALQVQSVRTPAYGEVAVAGSNQFALNYAAQTTTDTRSELGAWADTRRMLDGGTQLVMRGRAAWVHDFDPSHQATALFQTLPAATFVVNGAAAARDAALLSGAAELRLSNGVSLIGKLDGEFSGRSQTYAGTGTFRYAW